MATSVAVLVLVATAVTDGQRQRPGPSSPGHYVQNALPLWSGDTFTIVQTNERLPPYLYSSASGPGSGWNQPHSNTDPNVEGVTVVSDPTGLKSTTGSPGVRKVIKLTTDRHLPFDGYVRAQIRSPPLLGPGQDRWVIAEVYIPPGTPVVSGAPRTFWTILSIFGPPYAGASPDSFSIKRNHAGTGNDLTWNLPDGDPLWHTPATPGVWHIIARHILLSSDPKKGFSEVWYSQRAANGRPRGPLARQLVGGVEGIPRTRRRYYATLDPSHNWDGTPNSVNLTNYRTWWMWPRLRYVSLYFARYRVYDGRVPVSEIDPFYTGLR